MPLNCPVCKKPIEAPEQTATVHEGAGEQNIEIRIACGRPSPGSDEGLCPGWLYHFAELKDFTDGD